MNRSERMARMCPWCRSNRNSHIGWNEDEPVDGDLTVCWTCRQIGVYDDTGETRRPDRTEYTRAIADPEVRLALYLSTVASRPYATSNRRT